MDPIREAHLSEPGLLVIDVAGRDDATVFAFQAAIARIWGTAVAERTVRDAGQPGVRLRMYIDLRQVLEEASRRSRRVRGKAWSATTGGEWRTRLSPRCHTRPGEALWAGEFTASERTFSRFGGRSEARRRASALPADYW
ncbi:DUF6207 family protein [Streptomyces sp. NPDC001296]